MIRFHDLRTTYASNFVMAGGDIFASSKILGHTSVEMTATRYAALHPSYMRHVAHTVEFDIDGEWPIFSPDIARRGLDKARKLNEIRLLPRKSTCLRSSVVVALEPFTT